MKTQEDTGLRLQLALEAGKIGTWEFEIPSRALTCSAQCKANFGRAAEARFGYDDLLAALHPEDRPQLEAALAAAAASREEFALEYRFGWPDGTSHWLAISGTVVPEAAEENRGAARRMAGVTQEISARKRAENDLRESREILETSIQQRTKELLQEVLERRKAESELRDLSARLLTLRDSEQRRIARELHDSVGQYMAAALMSLNGIERRAELTGPERVALAEATDWVQQASQEVRVVSYLLHPPLLDELGLASAIRFYLDGFSQRSGIESKFVVAEDFERLPIEVETALFRVCQESLTNIHRHSGSKVAVIRLARIGESVELEVQDQGTGIPATNPWGVGLLGLRERIGQFGGTMKLESHSRGTTIRAELPLQA